MKPTRFTTLLPKLSSLLTALGLVVLLEAKAAERSPSRFALHLADYDAELRQADQRVDIPGLAGRLKELGATAYYWLIWHAPTDWDDLKLFLPAAAQANIEVWAYLVPPSEGPAGGYPASEPFKLDYPRWAEELARLSQLHTNLVGWVIDDFYANRKLFTPAYVRQLQTTAKAINPNFIFRPLMYFPEITSQFVKEYQPVIDGVVVAYPQDQEEIANARAILNGQSDESPGQFSCPWSTSTQAGDFVEASIGAEIVSTNHIRISFNELDDFTGPTAGYHFKQLLVDDFVLWEEDVAGGAKGWQKVEVEPTPALRGKTKASISFRLFDRKGVSNFGLRWRLKDLQADGLKLEGTLAEPAKWHVKTKGPFTAGFGRISQPASSLKPLPFMVMTAGSTDEFKLRHGAPATPERIAEWIKMCLQAFEQNQCDGVVIYCLDKGPLSQTFPLARDLFKNARSRN